MFMVQHYELFLPKTLKELHEKNYEPRSILEDQPWLNYFTKNQLKKSQCPKKFT